ncbi:S8 family serine peptidase [Actinoplanes sp. NPDC049668]|uniref:S8 family serine peptidase n=1 Tax=unclassified Actinoplanes TaxID=2626549 RepID=UPI0033B3B6D5
MFLGDRISRHGRRLVVGLTVVAAAGVGVPALAATPAPRSARVAEPPAEGFVHGLGAASAVPGRFIVLLRQDRATAQAVGATARSLVGDRIDRVFGSGVPGFTASLSVTEARRLAADPAVAVVEQDRKVRVSGTQRSAPWSLDRVDGRSRSLSGTFTPSSSAAGVHAYVIDTGIRISHKEFGGRASFGYDFVDGDSSARDCNGHGTHVAGSLGGRKYGVAKSVRLVAVRVLDCKGSGYNSDVVDGVNWVTANAIRPAVANMSLGGDYSAAVDQAVEDSIASGITYVVAAGNENANAYYGSPAGVAAAITVAATDRRDRRASFSNYGSIVDIFAPGVGVKSAYYRSDTATATLDGTSMASPHVAGAAALILAGHPAYRPAEVRSALVKRATTGKVTRRSGSPNRLLFVPAPQPPSKIATRSLPAALAGEQYSAQLKLLSGRTGRWQLASGSLPGGLRLSAGGHLSGVAGAAGTRRFTVRFTDYVPQQVKQVLSLTVRPNPPVIATRSIPTAVVGEPYSAQLTLRTARPGSWQLAAGGLPDGLHLSADGLLTGTPTAAGPRVLTVRFTDLVGQRADQALTLTVRADLPEIVTAALPSAMLGEYYRAELAIADQRTGTWSIEGALPAGLTLDPAGVISGVPTVGVTAALSLRFTDGFGQTGTRSVTLTVGTDPPVIAAAGLPDGTEAVAYSAQLTVADQRPGTWSIIGGQLPAGLNLTAAGLISGTPGAAGSHAFTVRFTDLLGQSSTRALTLTVLPDPPGFSWWYPPAAG